MAHYRASDSKREQFRRYLEKTGLAANLTNVLLSLYEQPERPSNALDFVKQHFGAVGETCGDSEALQQEVMDLRQRCARLTDENKSLKARGRNQPDSTVKLAMPRKNLADPSEED